MDTRNESQNLILRRQSSVHGIVSRRALMMLPAAAALVTISPASAWPAHSSRRGDYTLLDALEECGQWPSNYSWANAIHECMGARLVKFNRQSVRGENAALKATELALYGCKPFDAQPDGATVIVCSASGAGHLGRAAAGYRLVRDWLPANSYCASGSLVRNSPIDVVTVNVALAWF